MNSFLARLLDRHLNPANNVLPQVRGRFEPDIPFSMSQPANYPLEKSNVNFDSGKENFIDKNRLIKNPDWYLSQDISLKKEDKPVHLPVKKPENKSELIKSKDRKNEAGTFKKMISEPIKKPNDDNNKERQNLISHKSEFEAKEERSSEYLPLPDKNLPKGLNIIGEINGHEQPVESKRIKRKNTPELVVKPAQSDPGNSDSRKDSKVLGENSTRNQGALRSPQWLSDWKAGIKKETIIKETQTQSGPTIKVNIGRIEVRAMMQQVPSPSQPKESLKPKLSLDDYLNQRNRDQK